MPNNPLPFGTLVVALTLGGLAIWLICSVIDAVIDTWRNR